MFHHGIRQPMDPNWTQVSTEQQPQPGKADTAFPTMKNDLWTCPQPFARLSLTWQEFSGKRTQIFQCSGRPLEFVEHVRYRASDALKKNIPKGVAHGRSGADVTPRPIISDDGCCFALMTDSGGPIRVISFAR
jgi:hypothetical protein